MKRQFNMTAFMLTMVCAGLAFASGIPTVDPAAIQQMVKNAEDQAEQALEQLNTMKEQITQAKTNFEHQKSVTEGNWSLGDVLNNLTGDIGEGED